MRIYDRYLNLLTETDVYQSLQFTRKFHEIGEFELHINRYLQGAEHVKKGNIVSLGGNKEVKWESPEIELNWIRLNIAKLN